MSTRPPREIVLASAGSGKTFLISSRMIRLLAEGVPPEEILGATFTRKAAGEILDRILKRLAEGASSLPLARELSARVFEDAPRTLQPDAWAKLLETMIRSLHRVNVGTLDAFFMRSATAFGGEIGLPSGWSIPDESMMKRMGSEALSEVLATADRARMIELVRMVSRGKVRRSVHDHIARMMDELLEIQEQLDPDVAMPWRAFDLPPGSPPEPSREERVELAGALRSLPLPLTKAGKVRKSWSRGLAAIAALVVEGDWEGIAGNTLCGRALNGEEFDGGPIPEEIADCLESVMDAARRGVRVRLARQMEALEEVTRAYATVFRRLQAERGLFGFRDITRLIAEGDPLGGRLDFYYRLDARTQHVLLDEFQDTSLTQWEALAPIIDEVVSAEDRATVIVADPKQSIYGWRGAEPDVVHRVARQYDLTQQRLARSWRSSPIVLGFVNTIFERLSATPLLLEDEAHTATAERWLRDFEPHSSWKEHLPGYVQVEFGPLDESRGNRRPKLLTRAADRIAELHRASPAATIGVLTRTNNAVARLFLELRQRGIQVSQEGGNPLTDSAPCEAILALLRLVDHPADTISRYHVAETPIGEVLGYTDYHDVEAAAALGSRIRRRLLSEGYGTTVGELAARLAPFCEPREARRLSQLAELAYRYDESATLRTMDFIRLVETRRVEDRASAQVRVMTVHQAKGLEFDIVVLPQLDTQLIGTSRFPPAFPFRADPGGRITGVYPAAAQALRCLFPEVEPAFRQREAAALRDGLSSLYVALTRAKHALHVIIAADPESGISNARTSARLLREAIQDGQGGLTLGVEGVVLYSTGDPEWYSKVEWEPKAVHAPPSSLRLDLSEGRSTRRQTPSSLHGDATVDVHELLRIDNAAALQRGSLVHAWFEQIEWIDDWSADREALLTVGRSVAQSISERALRDALAEFLAWVSVPQLRAGLTRSRYPHPVVVERELPFMHRSGELLMEGAIDRLVISYDGDRAVAAEIIDFKSDRTRGSSSSVENLTARYAPQLRAYAAAVSAMYRIPREACSATLVFLEAGRLVQVGEEQPEGWDELEEGVSRGVMGDSGEGGSRGEPELEQSAEESPRGEVRLEQAAEDSFGNEPAFEQSAEDSPRSEPALEQADMADKRDPEMAGDVPLSVEVATPDVQSAPTAAAPRKRRGDPDQGSLF